MKLATFSHGGATRIGVVVAEEVVDLAAAVPSLPRDMAEFLEAGTRALDGAREAAARGGSRLPLAGVRLGPVVPRPRKFLAVGLNYKDHIAEAKLDPPKVPMIFNKQVTCVTGPHDPIHLPRASRALDYEGELGFAIGRRCRHVPRERAHEVIAGYCVVNDVSVRDWQMRVPTFTMGKSWDTHGPVGPWLTTPDEVGDPHALQLRTWVSGELRQNSNTKELLFDCFALVEHLSTAFTLEPGDLVATGTPAGVGGVMRPPRFLVAGDVVRIEIERLGRLENPVIAEPADTARI
jgi:2-keto-4-pentenoate hydratase/2-oxohepta-3-ene-1,7-dioic acid hydratase in catechol pathway